MKKILNIDDLELLINCINTCKEEHPKANIFYNIGEDRIVIEYKLPKDFKPLTYNKKS